MLYDLAVTFEELCDTADDQLFNKTVSNVSHVLSCSAHCSATTIHSVAALRSQASFTHAFTSRTRYIFVGLL